MERIAVVEWYGGSGSLVVAVCFTSFRCLYPQLAVLVIILRHHQSMSFLVACSCFGLARSNSTGALASADEVLVYLVAAVLEVAFV